VYAKQIISIKLFFLSWFIVLVSLAQPRLECSVDSPSNCILRLSGVSLGETSTWSFLVLNAADSTYEIDAIKNNSLSESKPR